MKAVLLAAVLAATTLAPVGAYADEPVEETPLAPEVIECLARYPGSVSLGNETEEIDTICMAFADSMPVGAQEGDVYVWCGDCGEQPPLTLPGPPPPSPAVPTEPPPYVPYVPSPEDTMLPAPEGIEATAVTSTDARVTWEPVAAPAVGRTLARMAVKVKYVTRCDGRKARTSRTKVRLRADRGDTCRVRTVGPDGLSKWSKKVKVRRAK